MADSTEAARKLLIDVGHPEAARKQAERKGEQTWTTEEMTRDFEVRGFMAPYVVVKRRSDGVVGSLEFTHSPRVYFHFEPDEGS